MEMDVSLRSKAQYYWSSYGYNVFTRCRIRTAMK